MTIKCDVTLDSGQLINDKVKMLMIFYLAHNFVMDKE